jgi:hypothetical protein
MDYYIEKSIQHRLEEAQRMQRNLDFARELSTARERERAAARRARGRFANWVPVARRWTRIGGAP